MEKIAKSPREILDLFPTRAELAREIGEADVTVRQWGRNNSIPGRADVALVSAAKKRGLKLTYEDLARARALAAAA